jgi:type IV pilus assembly protein PilW
MPRAASEPRLPGRDRGFSLLETLITIALFSIVIAGVYLLYTTMQNTMSRGELKTDLQQNARVGLDRMVQEIRMAGYDPSGAIPAVTLPPKAGIRAASSGCLSFIAYRPSSGASAQITYDLDGTTLQRREEPWNGSSAFTPSGAFPLAESVSVLAFTYYDAYNQVITPHLTTTKGCPPSATDQNITQLDYGQMNQIRRVAITLQTRESRLAVFRPDFQDTRSENFETYMLTSDVRLRNR